MIEVFDTETDGPCVCNIFDLEATSFDFIDENSLAVSDIEGNFTVLSNIRSPADLKLSIIKTKFPRIRQVKSHFTSEGSYQFLVSISTDHKIAFWSCDRLLAHESDDLEEMKADKVVKSQHRLTCIGINDL